MSLERKKEREKCEFEMALRHLFCCCSNLSNNYIITFIIWKSVLQGTKPLVDSIRHFIRDLSGLFSVCHLCECRTFNDVTIPAFCFC